MAFTEPEIKKFQELSDEMAKLIEDPEGTSNEASVAYGKIGRVCANVLSRHAAQEAKRSTRSNHVTKFQASRTTRAEKARSKKGGNPAPAPSASTSASSGGSRNRQNA
jgi:hypothetical protein